MSLLDGEGTEGAEAEVTPTGGEEAPPENTNTNEIPPEGSKAGDGDEGAAKLSNFEDHIGTLSDEEQVALVSVAESAMSESARSQTPWRKQAAEKQTADVQATLDARSQDNARLRQDSQMAAAQALTTAKGYVSTAMDQAAESGATGGYDADTAEQNWKAYAEAEAAAEVALANQTTLDVIRSLAGAVGKAGATPAQLADIYSTKGRQGLQPGELAENIISTVLAIGDAKGREAQRQEGSAATNQRRSAERAAGRSEANKELGVEPDAPGGTPVRSVTLEQVKNMNDAEMAALPMEVLDKALAATG